MNLTLRAIDKDNWEECVRLEVDENQKNFVAENWYSIIQATYQKDLFPFAIYDGEAMVGFLMYGSDPDTEQMEVCRLMVDKKQQQKGYGKAAMEKLLEFIKEEYGSVDFHTSAEPENVHAIRLYEQLGFVKTGEIMWGEVVLKIKL